ncbi:MAG: hypothetical protein FWE56_05715 [Candidatus Bathyarchaeota archaeon]|nr:hypothetical protein [Candidatus Termiticorpusculum sp.]MCL2868864.1 hypothetical protein [Candidatus Termiticorpusculum sp.]
MNNIVKERLLKYGGIISLTFAIYFFITAYFEALYFLFSFEYFIPRFMGHWKYLILPLFLGVIGFCCLFFYKKCKSDKTNKKGALIDFMSKQMFSLAVWFTSSIVLTVYLSNSVSGYYYNQPVYYISYIEHICYNYSFSLFPIIDRAFNFICYSIVFFWVVTVVLCLLNIYLHTYRKAGKKCPYTENDGTCSLT